jgi:hypothetical protein
LYKWQKNRPGKELVLGGLGIGKPIMPHRRQQAPRQEQQENHPPPQGRLGTGRLLDQGFPANSMMLPAGSNTRNIPNSGPRSS